MNGVANCWDLNKIESRFFILVMYKMSPSIHSVKASVGAIIKVARVKNTLQFMSARNPDIPSMVILTDNLKSIQVYNPRSTDSYTLVFNYMNKSDTTKDTERVHLNYRCGDFEWEDEVKKIVNEAVLLV